MASSTILETMKAHLRGQIICNCGHQKKIKKEVAHLKQLTEDASNVDRVLTQVLSPDLYKQRQMLQTEFNQTLTEPPADKFPYMH